VVSSPTELEDVGNFIASIDERVYDIIIWLLLYMLTPVVWKEAFGKHIYPIFKFMEGGFPLRELFCDMFQKQLMVYVCSHLSRNLNEGRDGLHINARNFQDMRSIYVPFL
jgi:hypothetical protein